MLSDASLSAITVAVFALGTCIFALASGSFTEQIGSVYESVAGAIAGVASQAKRMILRMFGIDPMTPMLNLAKTVVGSVAAMSTAAGGGTLGMAEHTWNIVDECVEVGITTAEGVVSTANPVVQAAMAIRNPIRVILDGFRQIFESGVDTLATTGARMLSSFVPMVQARVAIAAATIESCLVLLRDGMVNFAVEFVPHFLAFAYNYMQCAMFVVMAQIVALLCFGVSNKIMNTGLAAILSISQTAFQNMMQTVGNNLNITNVLNALRNMTLTINVQYRFIMYGVPYDTLSQLYVWSLHPFASIDTGPYAAAQAPVLAPLYQSLSDARLKRVIRVFDNVRGLDFVEYEWTPQATQLYGLEGRCVGFLAQQVRDVVGAHAVAVNGNGHLAIVRPALDAFLAETTCSVRDRALCDGIFPHFID